MGEATGKSVIIGRMPRVEGKQFKTLFIKVYDCEKPLTTDKFPLQDLQFENIEKAVFVDCVPEYFLEGNDLVFENIAGVSWEQEGNTMKISCQ